MDFNEPSDDVIMNYVHYWDPECLKNLFADDVKESEVYCPEVEDISLDDDVLVRALDKVEEM